MDKQEMYTFLKERGVWFEWTEHKALFSMADVADVEFPYPEGDAKNLFLRDKKKKNYYLITVNGDKKVDLRKFRDEQGTKALTFGSPEELSEKLGLIPGSVTPFGLLNDEDRSVHFYIDEDFFTNYQPDSHSEGSAAPEETKGVIGVHPCDNTATVVLRTTDLVDIIREHGSEITVITIPEK